MINEQKLREALRTIKHEAASLADAQVIALEALAQPADGGEVVKRKLIGWRTENYLWETDDPDKARNWEPNIGVLPIFEGDPNTKLTAPPASQEQAQQPTTQEQELPDERALPPLNVAQAELDELLDFIYEYSTVSEGISSRALKLCQAYARAAMTAKPVEQELPPLPAQTHFPGWAPIPYYTADQMRNYARAAIAAKPVPDGLKLVQIEPTPEMIDAGNRARVYREHGDLDDPDVLFARTYNTKRAWAAMLRATIAKATGANHEPKPTAARGV